MSAVAEEKGDSVAFVDPSGVVRVLKGRVQLDEDEKMPGCLRVIRSDDVVYVQKRYVIDVNLRAS